MPFPVSASGDVLISDGWEVEEILLDIATRLSELGADQIRVDGDTVFFKVGRRSSHGPLGGLDGGHLRVREPGNGVGRRVAYFLSFRRDALTVAGVIYGGFGIGITVVDGQPPLGSAPAAFALCTVMFCWLFGFLYLLTPGRVQRALHLARYSADATTRASGVQ